MQDTPASHPTRRPATYADLEAVPENQVAEILDGELVTHPRPLPRHGLAHAALIDELVGPYQKGRAGPGGWLFITEPELHLGAHVIVPDIAAWRLERLPRLPDFVGITVSPDWLCEVLSPSTARYDRTVKMRIYHAHGVGHLWYVDPAYCTLEVFARAAAGWSQIAAFGDGEEVSAPPFEAISFPLDRLWPFDARDEGRRS